MEYSKEFKEAISNFTSREKDKLLFRLLKKDKILSQKLYFELIDEESADVKREFLEKEIAKSVESYSQYLSNPKYFLVLIRKISAKITLHVKVTSDKFGEVSLHLFLVKEVLKLSPKLVQLSTDYVYKLYLYLINKIFKALSQIKKLDEDYWIELNEYLEEIENQLEKNLYFKKLCINNGLDFNWLKTDRIPENIDDIIKQIKQQGFLR